MNEVNVGNVALDIWSFSIFFLLWVCSSGLPVNVLTTDSQRKSYDFSIYIYQFLSCKYSHHGQFKTTNVMSLDTVLERA